ncbi:protein kinase 4-like [Sitodiplosis mosellana]|uniref:protein kinase 4-like n=1 Tax=Sitodiplosis mosellana TaxID=263140 RepID=UPI002443C106|nr:protein kinase 4-like [Sitodiplosis mosellana]
MNRSQASRLENLQLPLKLDQLIRELKTLQSRLRNAEKRDDLLLIESLRSKVNHKTKEVIAKRNRIVEYLFEGHLTFKTLPLEELLKKEEDIEAVLRLSNLDERRENYINILNELKQVIKEKSKLRSLESFISSEMVFRSPLNDKEKETNSGKKDREPDDSDSDTIKDVDEKMENINNPETIPDRNERGGAFSLAQSKFNDPLDNFNLKSSNRYSEDLKESAQLRPEKNIKDMNEFFDNLRIWANDTTGPPPKPNRDSLKLNFGSYIPTPNRKSVKFSEVDPRKHLSTIVEESPYLSQRRVLDKEEGYDTVDITSDDFVNKRRPKRDELVFRPDHFSLTETELRECAEQEARYKNERLNRERSQHEQEYVNPFSMPGNRFQQVDSNFQGQPTMYFQSDFTSRNIPQYSGSNVLPVSNTRRTGEFSSINEPVYVDMHNLHISNRNMPTNSNVAMMPQNSSADRIQHPSINPNNFFASAQPSNYFQDNFPQNLQQYRNVPTQTVFNPPNQAMSAQQLDQDATNDHEIRRQFLRRLKSIPKFDGSSYRELIDFVDISDTLFRSCMNEAEENEFYEQMILQLRGEAKQVISNSRSSDWDTIKSKLQKHFSYLANKEVLTSQLENMRQEKDESLAKYAERARKMLQEKNSVYKVLTEDQKLEHSRMARKAFAKGIQNSNLKTRLVTRGASSLEDAIAYAIEAETDELYEIPKRELYCRHCRLNGHREKLCRFKNTDNNGINTLISALQSFSASRTPNRNNRDGSNRFGQVFDNDRFNQGWDNINNNNNNNSLFFNRNWNTRNNNGQSNQNWFARNNNSNSNNNSNNNQKSELVRSKG